MSEISRYEKFMKSCEPYQEIINDVTLDECMSVASGIPISCNREEIIIRAIGQRLLKLEKIEQVISDKYIRLKDFEDDDEWERYENNISMRQIEQIVKGEK